MNNTMYFANYLLYYLMLCKTLVHESNRHLIAKHLMSAIVCSVYCTTQDINLLIPYYWYDLLIEVIPDESLQTIRYIREFKNANYRKNYINHYLSNLNYIMIIHHIITLYCITLDFPDVDKIRQGIMLFKISDLFVHYDKILRLTNLRFEYERCVLYTRIILQSISSALWIIYRLYLPIYVFPFRTTTMYVIAVIFYLGNITWTIKMVLTLKKTIQSALYIEFNH